MPDSITASNQAAVINKTTIPIDFSVERARARLDFETFAASPDDLDLAATAELLETAEIHYKQKDFKTTAQLVEKALPGIDRLYSRDDVGKLRALRILRDSYLALSKGVEAKDCAEVGLAYFEDIMKNKTLTKENLQIGDPSAFARPVVRKLKTLRRSKDSESLRKKSIEVAEKWRTFCKAT